jgi:hypothetical protein
MIANTSEYHPKKDPRDLTFIILLVLKLKLILLFFH